MKPIETHTIRMRGPNWTRRKLQRRGLDCLKALIAPAAAQLGLQQGCIFGLAVEIEEPVYARRTEAVLKVRVFAHG